MLSRQDSDAELAFGVLLFKILAPPLVSTAVTENAGISLLSSAV